MKQKFSVEAFWKKVKHVAKQAGQSVIYASLLLFYVLQRPDVPKRVKIIVIEHSLILLHRLMRFQISLLELAIRMIWGR